eukprot:gene1387-60327_t
MCVKEWEDSAVITGARRELELRLACELPVEEELDWLLDVDLPWYTTQDGSRVIRMLHRAVCCNDAVRVLGPEAARRFRLPAAPDALPDDEPLVPHELRRRWEERHPWSRDRGEFPNHPPRWEDDPAAMAAYREWVKGDRARLNADTRAVMREGDEI